MDRVWTSSQQTEYQPQPHHVLATYLKKTWDHGDGPPGTDRVEESDRLCARHSPLA
jgi:hypothetical protein